MGRTTYLYAKPNWLSGAVRIIDMGGTYDCYNQSANAAEADRIALASDWLAVGEDLRDAIVHFAIEHDQAGEVVNR